MSTLLARGKVRELYDLGDDLLMVASDRISTYDVVHPTPIPDKGKVLTGLSVRLVRSHARPRPQPPRVRDRRRPGRVPRARAARQAPQDAPRRGGRARLPVGLGLEGLPGDGRGLGHRAAGGPARVRPAARADLHPVDQGRRGSRRGDRLRAHGRADRRPRAGRAGARHDARRLLGDRRARPHARGDPRRHEVRVRARRRRRADARRRGRDAGLLALLARRPVRAGPRAAVVRQAVRARLGVRDRLGQVAAGARDPRRRRGRDARALRDRLRDAGGRALLRLAGADRAGGA